MLGPFIVRLDRHGEEIVPTESGPRSGERDVVLDSFDRYRQGMLLREGDLLAGMPRPTGAWYYRRDRMWSGQLAPTQRTPAEGQIWYQGAERKVGGPEMKKYAEYLLTTYPTFRPQPGSLEAKVAAELSHPAPYSWDYDLGTGHLLDAIEYHDPVRLRQVLAEEPLDKEGIQAAVDTLLEGSDADYRYPFSEQDLVALLSRVPDRDRAFDQAELTYTLEQAVRLRYDNLALAAQTVLTAMPKPEVKKVTGAPRPGSSQSADTNGVFEAIQQRDGSGYELAREWLRRGESIEPAWLPGTLSARDVARLVEEFNLTVSQGFHTEFEFITEGPYRIFVAHGMEPTLLAVPFLNRDHEAALVAIEQADEDDLLTALALTVELPDDELARAIIPRLALGRLDNDIMEAILHTASPAFLAAAPAPWFQYILRNEVILGELPRRTTEYLIRSVPGAAQEPALLNAVAVHGWLDLGQEMLQSGRFDPQTLDRVLWSAYTAGQVAWARRFGGPEMLARQAEQDAGFIRWEHTLSALPTSLLVALLEDGLPARWLPASLVERMLREPWTVARLPRGVLLQLRGVHVGAFRAPLDRAEAALASLLSPDLLRYVQASL